MKTIKDKIKNYLEYIKKSVKRRGFTGDGYFVENTIDGLTCISDGYQGIFLNIPGKRPENYNYGNDPGFYTWNGNATWDTPIPDLKTCPLYYDYAHTYDNRLAVKLTDDVYVDYDRLKVILDFGITKIRRTAKPYDPLFLDTEYPNIKFVLAPLRIETFTLKPFKHIPEITHLCLTGNPGTYFDISQKDMLAIFKTWGYNTIRKAEIQYNVIKDSEGGTKEDKWLNVITTYERLQAERKEAEARSENLLNAYAC